MILERDGNDCVWCRRTFDNHLVAPPTTEHLVPRIRAASWVENEVAACKSATTNVGIARLKFADECEGLARTDVARIIRSLERLADAIAIRGGSAVLGHMSPHNFDAFAVGNRRSHYSRPQADNVVFGLCALSRRVGASGSQTYRDDLPCLRRFCATA